MQTPFYVRPFIFGLITFFVTLISCDDEISDVGSGALSGTEIIIVDSVSTNITTTQISTNSTRANNLNYNLLGRFPGESGDNNPYIASYHILGQVFGVTNSFAETESAPTENNGLDTLSVTTTTYTLDDINLVIPFRYSFDETTDDGNQYNVESEIYGVAEGQIDLKVYKSNFELQEDDPNDINFVTQVYFSNAFETGEINRESVSGEIINLDNNSQEVEDAVFSYSLSNVDSSFNVPTDEEEVEEVKEEEVKDEDGVDKTVELTTITTDGTLESDEIARSIEQVIRIPLSNSFKESLITLMTNEDGEIDLGELTDDTITRDLQGIFIEVMNTSTGVIEVMEFGESLVPPGIEMTFTKTTAVDFTDEDEMDTIRTETVYSTFQMNTSSGRVVNLVDIDETIVEDVSEDTILLRSGRSNVGMVRLFEDLSELNCLVSDNVLLNDAELILTLNQDSSFYNEANFPSVLEVGEQVSDSSDDDDEAIEYSNIMVTDLTSGAVLVDYSTNLTSEDDDPAISLQRSHLIPLQDLDGEQVYRINITQYLSNILDRDPIEGNCEDNNLEDLEDLIEAEELSLIISPTNDITLTSASEIDNGNSSEDIFVNQGAVLSFKTIPIYSSSIEDENKKPRIILKYTSTE